eukprot:snap_masked-scaffold_33-processed-gene-2.45-mRNA-1 protein AED:1.00 eAED:1.00 QI:0/0/0/0/1/1/2/0/89
MAYWGYLGGAQKISRGLNRVCEEYWSKDSHSFIFPKDFPVTVPSCIFLSLCSGAEIYIEADSCSCVCCCPYVTLLQDGLFLLVFEDFIG